ncbi:hypothetical protein BGZ73_004189 [Actinomortierella ambigua]|nr:hypothetical protein BGZ73_004189 [Actinomortierella ambigua]
MVIVAAVDNIDPALFNKWTDDIEKARQGLCIQGSSVAVVHKGKIVYAQGFGKRNDKDPFTPHTVSAIASMTKSFTAAAVGELVANQKASWDVPVTSYLPEFQLSDPNLTSEITFVDLLAHRTGLPAIGREWVHRPETRIELIKQLRYLEPEAPVRTKYIYSDKTYTVAGEAAARIAGKPYEQLVLDTVVRPLGMNETGFSFQELAKRANHALPYSCKNFAAAQRGEIRRTPLDTATYHDMPAGGLFSNIYDMANYVKAIMHDGALDGKQILNKESVQKLRTAHNIVLGKPFAPEFSITAYGLGWGVGTYRGHFRLFHNGALSGYRSFMNLFPDDDVAIIYLSNNKIDQLVEYIPFYMADDIFKLPKTRDWIQLARLETPELFKMYGKEDDQTYLEFFFPPQVKDKPPTRRLADFAGDYVHPVIGKFNFKRVKVPAAGHRVNETADASPRGRRHNLDHGYGLAFQMRDFEGILEHYHYDSFRLRVLNDIIAFSSLVTFLPGEDGSIKQFRIVKDDGTYVVNKV